MKKVQVVVSALFLVLVLVACAPAAAPAPAPQALAPQVPAPARGPVAAPAVPVRLAWQERWETVLAAAKREGRVVVVTPAGSETRAVIAKAMKDTYGLKVESLSGRTNETEVKLAAERRAGLYLEDVFVGSTASTANVYKPAGFLEPLDAALILPEVTDPKLWYKGEFPWFDRDHVGFAFSLFPGRAIAINTNLVKPDEVKSWRDLLNPKWKGKLILNDPTAPGAGQMSIMAMDMIMGWDYVKELAKAEPIIMRDQRQQLDWLAHGKISILIAPKPDGYVEFMKAGAPVAIVEPVEGTWLNCANGAIALFNNAPNPNAAKVFLNWLLSKEGQTLYSNAVFQQSARLDVSTADLPPGYTRKPGGKYFPTYDEAGLARRLVTDKLAMELFGSFPKK